MAANVKAKLHFPSEDKIIAYLATHPDTKDASEQEKKIITVVAGVFKNSIKPIAAVQKGVMLTLSKYKNLPNAEAFTMKINQALEDCAKGERN